MSYVRKVIGQNEHLVMITRLHWIYFLEAVIWFAAIFGFGLLADHYLWLYAGSHIKHYEIDMYFYTFDQDHTPIPWAFGFTGVAAFLPLFSTYLSTEIGLTDRRIIHKRGLFMIEVQQVELEDIRGESVKHGWLGWLLGYGRIHFDCRFIDDMYLPAVRDPYRLVKAVHTARMRSEKIPYTANDLDTDISRINQQRIEAFKTREKMKRMASNMRSTFNIVERRKRSG